MTKFWSGLLVLPLATSLTVAQNSAEFKDPAAASVTSSTSTPSRVISFGSEGLLFSTRDKAYQLRIHGYVQADNRMFSQTVQGTDYDKFLFRRIRPLLEGTLFNAVDFRFMPDFGQSNPQIQEAYLELNTFPIAKPRVGKFKEPIGMEVLKSDRDLTFVERSLVSDLIPLRYMGAQIGGSLLSDSVAYAVGYFNGTNDGSNGNFQWLPANEFAARVFFRPFAKTTVSALHQFGFGAGGSEGVQHGTLPAYKTVGQTTFFKYSSSAVADGQHNRISPQAYYYVGPIGLMGEYAISSQEVLNKSVLRRLRNEAWQVAGSVMLTGEKNSYGSIRPRRSFEPNRGFRHLGAIEVAFRYSDLRVDPSAFPLFANPKSSAQQATARTIGVNWYLNRFVKLVTDYEITRFRVLSANSTLHGENVLISRLQLAF